MTIKAVDTVRKPDDLDAFDKDGYEGRWLDVPRLPAQNPGSVTQSSLWSGRAAAAMIYDYHCKFAEKADEYVGHEDGEVGPGPNGAKLNLRYLGGSQSGKLAGIDEGGKVDVQRVFTAAGLAIDGGNFCKPNEEVRAEQAERRLQPIIGQLKANNPVLLFTAMSKGEGGHIVAVVGYKKTPEGALWLRINDPDLPKDEYIKGEYKLMTPPGGPEAMFTEYWLRAAALFASHPTQPPKKLYSYTGNWGRYVFVVPAKPIPDSHELVHKLLQGAGSGSAKQAPAAAAAAPEAAPEAGGSGEKEAAKPEAAKEGAPAAAAEEKKPEKKAAAKPSSKTVEEIEPAVLTADYKDVGRYEGGKFANAELQKVLEHYCQQDGIDPAAMSEHGAKKEKGGDLEISATTDLPLWYATWRKSVALKGKWDDWCLGRSKVGEAFSRWFFRKLCKDKGQPYPASADEFFANLWKSNSNGKSKDMGGPGGIYCAAASNVGLRLAASTAGCLLPFSAWASLAKTYGSSQLKTYKVQPGDVLTIVTAGTPHSGHVVTALCPLNDGNFSSSGELWVVSGNCGPMGNVAADLISFEAMKSGYVWSGATQWGSETKPSAGKAWLINATEDSLFMPGKVESLDKSKLRSSAGIKQGDKVETAGSKPGKIKDDGAAAGGEEPAGEKSGEKAEAKEGGGAAGGKEGAPEKKESGDDSKTAEGGGGAAGGGKPAGPPKAKAKNDGPPPPAALPPKTGFPRLPIAIDGSLEVTGENLTNLYHSAERGNGGYFPLGDAGLFHSGVHLMPDSGSECYAIADGEVVAARIGEGPGVHPWGDTGFVITRHVLKGDKLVYSLLLHLKKETLHPDRTEVGWLKRLLIAAMGGDPPKKTKWRVIEALPTWTDEDKGKFSPTTVKNDKLLAAGVYEEEEQVFLDHKHYVKLKGLWVRGSGGAGDEDRIKEMSPWSAFDIEEASKNSAVVKALNEGKTAVFDTDKKDGKRRWTVDAGEPVGTCGTYLGAPALHWSIFSKDEIYPTGELLDEEWGQADEVKLKSIDVSSKDAGTPEHGKALVEALDPDKKVFGKEKDESVVQPVELRKFYRTPTIGWRGRYTSVKAVVDFKLDVDKLMGQDRYKSHAEDERTDFKTNAKPFVFWDDLSSAEDFPTDGKAVFVHPVSGVRLMASVAVAQDHDDPKELPGGIDRLHADEDVVVSLRDKAGPLAAAKIVIKADGKTVKTGTTDSAGELIVQLEDLAGHEVQVQVEEALIGKDGMLVTLINETSGPVKLQPGDAPGNQSFNGKDVVPDPKLDLPMRVKKGAKAVVYQTWNPIIFKPEGAVSEEGLAEGRQIQIERFVFRREDGKFEAVEAVVDGQRSYLWSIEDGKTNLEAEPPKTGSGDHKDPAIHATWTQRVAHVNEHPVFAGRVENIDDGKELELSFFAIRAMDGAEHDVQLEAKKVKVVAGGLSADFDPGQLVQGQNLLNTPRPIYAKIKVGEATISLRDQAVTIYAADAPFPDPKPAPPAEDKGDGKPMAAYFSIKRGAAVEKLTLWDGSPAATKKLKDIGDPARHRFVADEGADDLYVGTVTTMPHLPLESEARMTPAEALEHHKAATMKAEPDLPGWAFAASARAATADNGIAAGLCATHCKTAVSAEGLATGCTEAIRVRNLGSCHNAHHGECQKAVAPIQLGKPPVVSGCAGYAGSCAEVAHDKSKCFVTEAVLGAGAADRERWSVALPMRIKDDKNYDYKGNLRVLLVNPSNGKAVVASQEARGPKTNCETHEECDNIGLKKDELKDKGRIAACSYEVAFKLGLPRAGGDGVVLMAFVPVTTALGPVPDEKVFKLRKEVAREGLAGTAAIPEPVPPPRPATPPKPGAEAKVPPPPMAPPEKQPKNAVTADAPPPAPVEPAAPPAPAPSGLPEVRQKMIDIAKAEVGQVDDRGGEGGKRKGWEHLKDYLEKALAVDAEKQGWLPALQKPNGRAGGLHWCGIFAVWCAIKAGLDVKWKFGAGPQGLGKYRTDKKYAPGDILVCKGALNHHCVLVGFAEGGKLETVNGNSFYQSVALANRDPSEIALYYRLSDQGAEG